MCRTPRWISWPNRSWRRWPPANGKKTSCFTSAGAPIHTAVWTGTISTRWSRCWPTALTRAGEEDARTCITIGSIGACAPGAEPAWRRLPRAARSPIPRITPSSPSRRVRWSVRWMKTLRWRVWPGTSSCWATRPGAFEGSRPEKCGSKMPTERRRRFRSGGEKPRRAPRNCPPKSPPSDKRSLSGFLLRLSAISHQLSAPPKRLSAISPSTGSGPRAKSRGYQLLAGLRLSAAWTVGAPSRLWRMSRPAERCWERCRPSRPSSQNGSLTKGAGCNWCCTRRSGAGSTAPGAWRCGSGSV